MYVFNDARGLESPGSGHADCEPPDMNAGNETHGIKCS